MSEIKPFDFCVALFVLFVGLTSLYTALNLWAVRNGGILTRALVAKLTAWAIWGAFVVWEVFTGRHAENIDRLILSVPQCVILLWILPRGKRGDLK